MGRHTMEELRKEEQEAIYKDMEKNGVDKVEGIKDYLVEDIIYATTRNNYKEFLDNPDFELQLLNELQGAFINKNIAPEQIVYKGEERIIYKKKGISMQDEMKEFYDLIEDSKIKMVVDHLIKTVKLENFKPIRAEREKVIRIEDGEPKDIQGIKITDGENDIHIQHREGVAYIEAPSLQKHVIIVKSGFNDLYLTIVDLLGCFIYDQQVLLVNENY